MAMDNRNYGQACAGQSTLGLAEYAKTQTEGIRKEAEESELSTILSNLSGRIDFQFNILKELAAKLKPVLADVPEAAGAGKSESLRVSCALSDELHTRIQQLDATNNIIHSLLRQTRL